MNSIKKSWKKKDTTPKLNLDIIDKVAGRGSFVIVRNELLYGNENKNKDDKEKETKKDLENMDTKDIIILKTAEANLKLWMNNLVDNLPTISKSQSIYDLLKTTDKTAIIVCAGPSFKENKHIDILKGVKNKTIITTDRMLIPLLKEGIEPDIVVSLDGNREFVVKFFQSDLIKNIKTKGVISITSPPNVLKTFKGIKYFFTPQIDETTNPSSLSKAMSYMTNTPILSSGGNTGTTCALLAAYLGYKNIILTGMDLGYTPETDIEKTQYYDIVKKADPEISLEKFKETFLEYGHNPLFESDYYTDKVFSTYRDFLISCSLELYQNGIKIINATEGGSVHGGAIIGMKLKEALDKYE